MRYATVCSGIGAPECAWGPLGWECAWQAEIEKFPSAVLAHHFPGVPNRGDMTKFREWPDEPEGKAIELICGGTPCQSFSVAGLRKGLDDPRGNLALVFLGIVDHYRPRWVVWENVPGVLSVDGGRAFGSFVGGLAKLGYGLCWRILDAQYFGVPQRRRRVFVAGYLGNWRPAAAVLLEPESLRGDSPPGREAGESPARCVARGAGASGYRYDPNGEDFVTNALDSFSGGPDDNAAQANHIVAFKPSHYTRDKDGAPSEIVPPLSADADKGDQDTLIVSGNPAPIPFDTTQITSKGNYSAPKPGDPCHPLAEGAHPPAIAFTCKDYGQDAGEIAPTLRAMGHARGHANAGGQVAVAFGIRSANSHDKEKHAQETEVARTLDMTGGFASNQGGLTVRRLTPRECERLQGFPTTIKRAIVRICLGHQKNSAYVEIECRRSQSNALPVDGDENIALAQSADLNFWNDRESREALVAVHVRFSRGPKVQGIRNLGKWNWFVCGAEQPNLLPHLTKSASFAHALALISPELEALTTIGRVAYQKNISFSIPRKNGSGLAVIFGPENEAHASDAETIAREEIKFITSNLGRKTNPCDLTETTLLCSALNVISLCIPEGTPTGNSFNLVLDLEIDHTLVPFNGRPAADGPRYRAIGNAMAVPVVRWIGERIQMMEA